MVTLPVRWEGRGEPAIGSTNSQVAFVRTVVRGSDNDVRRFSEILLTRTQVEGPEIVQKLSIDLTAKDVEL